jgi:hypothetical protein
MTDMTHVDHFYVDNLSGNLKATVRVARSKVGEPYPAGSVLQLVPTEVMVKRERGINPCHQGLGVLPTGRFEGRLDDSYPWI